MKFIFNLLSGKIFFKLNLMYNKLQDATLTIKSSTLEGNLMYCNPCNLQKLCLGNDRKLKTKGQSVYIGDNIN